MFRAVIHQSLLHQNVLTEILSNFPFIRVSPIYGKLMMSIKWSVIFRYLHLLYCTDFSPT